MPPKKKKGGAGKGKGKKKAAAAAAAKEETVRVCRSFLKVYQQRCAAADSTASPRICRDCRECVENERPLAKFIFEPSPPPNHRKQSTKPTTTPEPKQAAPTQNALTPADLPAVAASAAITAPAAPPKTVPPLPLQPLMDSWMEVKYSYMRCLHIWHMQLMDDSIVALALFFDSSLGPNLKVLEMLDVNLSPWAIQKLARSLRSSQLSVLNLDYNVLPQPSLAKLCEALHSNTTLQTLSLNYCHLDTSCGELLGALAAVTQIKELSLAGNRLECEGATDLLRPIIAVCESGEPNLPPLARLFLQDNAIDSHGMGGMFAPVICMRAFKRWILSSPVIEAINLDGNLVGDGGGREVMQAMKERKEAGLPPIKVTVTHRLSQEIFTAVIELCPLANKKGKKKGKKGKKKK